MRGGGHGSQGGLPPRPGHPLSPPSLVPRTNRSKTHRYAAPDKNILYISNINTNLLIKEDTLTYKAILIHLQLLMKTLQKPTEIRLAISILANVIHSMEEHLARTARIAAENRRSGTKES